MDCDGLSNDSRVGFHEFRDDFTRGQKATSQGRGRKKQYYVRRDAGRRQLRDVCEYTCNVTSSDATWLCYGPIENVRDTQGNKNVVGWWRGLGSRLPNLDILLSGYGICLQD